MGECIICKHDQCAPLYDGIVRCQSCGHVYADLNLSDEDLLNLYRKNYFFGEEYSDYVEDRPVIQKNFVLRLRVLQRFLDPKLHRSLLEIGSAYGFFLDIAREKFDTVQGIDITEDGVRYARDKLNLDVIQADVLQYDFGSRMFDVVCLWDTIEHLRDPRLYIQKISRHTRSGGLIAITTGDIDSLNARLRREKWRLIHPPTHIHYFSKRTLAKLLGMHGFDVVYSRYCGFYRSTKNVAYNILVLRQGNRRLYELLGRMGLYRFDFYLNTYDIMYVIARKR